MSRKNSSYLDDGYKTDEQLWDELRRISYQLIEDEDEIRRWEDAHSGGSAGGLLGVYGDRTKRRDEIVRILRERGVLSIPEDNPAS